MSLVNKIKELADEKHVTIAEVERQVGISNGQIRRWDTASPKSKNLKKVADYFGVTTDYLLGNNNVPKWATKEEVVELDKLLDSNVNMSYGGETLSPEQIQRVKDILIATFWDIVKEDKEKGKKMWAYGDGYD